MCVNLKILLFAIKYTVSFFFTLTYMLGKRKIILPQKNAFSIPTSEDFPKLHTLMVASGKRGGGKSVAVANFIREARDRGYFDRVWLVSPTYHSNKQIWDICYINASEKNTVEKEFPDLIEPDSGAIKHVINLVESERKEWDEFLVKKKRYEEFIRYALENASNLERAPWDVLRRYAEYNFFVDGPPKWKYAKEQPPRLAVIIDDCLGTQIFSSPTEGLVNLCIKHRHVGKGLGISMFILTQAYSSLGGLPRPIRENCTMLLLFEQTDVMMRKKEFSEIGTRGLTEEKFYQMLDECTSEPYGFLTIDFNPKTESRRFSKNFHTYIQLSHTESHVQKV